MGQEATIRASAEYAPAISAHALSAFAQDPGTLPPDADRDPRDGVVFFAALGDEPLEVGATLTARVEIALDEGVSATDSGMPGFILQLDPPPPFPIVADLDRRITTAYDRTTAYLIDADGVVRQIFPMLIHMRATGRALLREARTLR